MPRRKSDAQEEGRLEAAEAGASEPEDGDVGGPEDAPEPQEEEVGRFVSVTIRLNPWERAVVAFQREPVTLRIRPSGEVFACFEYGQSEVRVPELEAEVLVEVLEEDA